MIRPAPTRRSGPIRALGPLLGCLLAACGPDPAGTGGAQPAIIPPGTALAAELQPDRGSAPDTAPGLCWGSATTPAVIETVTEQAELTPERRAADGSLLAAATYRSTTRQRIVADRQAVWFRVPCPEAQDEAFIASLQRALKVRGLYRGPVTGQADAATAAAVRRYQAPQGLDSATLSLAAARQLGLAVYDRGDL